MKHGVSQHRAFEALGVVPSSARYARIRPDDCELYEAKRQAAPERRRFGYRRNT